jgi:hypothetical protein
MRSAECGIRKPKPLVRGMRVKGMKPIPLTNIRQPQFWFLCVSVSLWHNPALGIWGKMEKYCRVEASLIRLNQT